MVSGVEQGWTCTAAAKIFMIAAQTAAKQAQRGRAEGLAAMTGRSCRPHHSPARTPSAWSG
ncbi:leucine zipper domain-containing protein [Amycolatopsis sp. NPDC101161]|uniref:leucine zipper domain-containing protein n=1 Tax=Amycolatopsis sp. NPDC101161 TaxID=3363940 RepID=UPI0038124E44